MSFPCKLCGQPRTAGSKSNKHKICSACYNEIISGRRRDETKHVTKCVMCGADVDRYSVSPTCMAGNCRSKWYRNQEIKRQIDNMIQQGKTKDISLKLTRLVELGYEVVVSRNE